MDYIQTQSEQHPVALALFNRRESADSLQQITGITDAERTLPEEFMIVIDQAEFEITLPKGKDYAWCQKRCEYIHIEEDIPLLSGHDLTPEERKDLDYIGDPEKEEDWIDCHQRFFRYRENIYDIHEFNRVITYDQPARGMGQETRAYEGSLLLTWGFCQSDSYFSGVVFRYETDEDSEDSESVTVGTYVS